MSDLSPISFLLILVNTQSGAAKSWRFDFASLTGAKEWLRKKQLAAGPLWRAEIRDPASLALLGIRRHKGRDWETPERPIPEQNPSRIA